VWQPSLRNNLKFFFSVRVESETTASVTRSPFFVDFRRPVRSGVARVSGAGATLEFGTPEAHKNTYCTVTGS